MEDENQFETEVKINLIKLYLIQMTSKGRSECISELKSSMCLECGDKIDHYSCRCWDDE